MATPKEVEDKLKLIEDRLNRLFGREKTEYSERFKLLKEELEKGNVELEKFDILLRDITNTSDELNSNLKYVASSFRDSVAELSKQNTELNSAKSSLKSISKIATEIVYENSQGVLIEDEILGKLEKKAKLEFENLKIAVLSGRIKGKDLEELKISLSQQELFFESLKKIRNQQLEIKKDSGVRIFTGLEAISNAIPGLSKFTSAFKDASKASQEQALYNQRIFGTVKNISVEEQKALNEKLDKYKQLRAQGANINDALKQAGVSAKQVQFGKLPEVQSISALRAGINSLGPALAKALGPLVMLKELVDAFLKSDQIVGDMAKGLNMSYSNALAMKQELTSAANASGDISITSRGLSESLMAINKELGTSVMLNKENLVTFTKFRESAGMTNEELMGMQSLVNATNGDLGKMTEEFLGHASVAATKNKAALNEKQLMTEISKLSAATTLSLGKQPKALAEAVATAKALGMEMEQLERIAEGLLNFEQSISSEIEAELLTSKQLNLEQARYYALTNNVQGLAQELNKNIGSAADFGKMNRIQQEALAKAVGMNREELAKTLYIQEQIRGVSKEEAKLREREINRLIREGYSVEEATMEIGKKKREDLENQASIQGRFNKSVEKLKEIFVTVAESLMPILDILSNIFKVVGYVVKGFEYIMKLGGGLGGVLLGLLPIFISIGKALKTNTVLTFKGAVAAIFNSFAQIPFGLGIPLAVLAVGGLSSLIAKAVGDLNSPAKGKTMVSTKEGGLFELSPNDDVVAAPGVSKKLASLESSKNTPPSIQPLPSINAAPPPPLSINLSSLESKMDKLEQTNTLLSQLIKKDTSVYMDGAKVGKSIALAGSNLG